MHKPTLSVTRSLSTFLLLISFSNIAQNDNEISSTSNEVRYISDELFTFIRSGPSSDFRLLGSITAGTKVELIEVNRDAGYAKIEDQRGRVGWVESKFVSRKPSIRESLVIMQKQIDDKQLELNQINSQLEQSYEKLNRSEQQKAQLNRQVTLHLEQVEELANKLEQKDKANNMQWFTHGAILGVASLLIGFFMGVFARKQNNANRLM